MAATQQTTKHPAPHRGKTSRLSLMIGLFGTPFSWLVLMSGSYITASYACFPHRTPLNSPLWQSLNFWLSALTVLCFISGLFSGAVAYKSWQLTKNEKKGGKKQTVDAGDGRARFLAMMGLMSSSLFILAIIFTALAILLVSPCKPF